MGILNDEFLLFLKCAGENNLRYMLIGGYAVNYYGYVRNTDDMDVWLAPTNENRQSFINTLLCMKYSENEVAPLYQEDFTAPFVGNVGGTENRIDFLTVVHYAISYDEAEKGKNTFEIIPNVFMHLVPYDFLKNIKLRSARPKDLWDVARLEELRNKTK